MKLNQGSGDLKLACGKPQIPISACFYGKNVQFFVCFPLIYALNFFWVSFICFLVLRRRQRRPYSSSSSSGLCCGA
jgi:hypothetical protein